MPNGKLGFQTTEAVRKTRSDSTEYENIDCRVFSRFEKSVKNFLSFIYFVAALIWLR